MPFLMAPCTYVVWVVFEESDRPMFSDRSDFIWNRNSEVAWLWEVREPGQLLWAVKRSLPAPDTFEGFFSSPMAHLKACAVRGPFSKFVPTLRETLGEGGHKELFSMWGSQGPDWHIVRGLL